MLCIFFHLYGTVWNKITDYLEEYTLNFILEVMSGDQDWGYSAFYPELFTFLFSINFVKLIVCYFCHSEGKVKKDDN